MTQDAGRIVLVSGATTGIGFATAEAFLQEGATVIITGANDARLTRAKTELGERCHAFLADNARLEASKALADFCRDRFGRIDVLIANAGICLGSTIVDVTEAEYDREMDINLKGTLFLIQHCVPLIPSGGAIAITTSGNDDQGIPGQLVYSATKAALRSVVRTLAAELAPRGIRVNGVAPGPIDTPIFDKALPDPKAAQAMREFEAGLPALKRLGRPSEVADAFVYLAGRKASFITGANLRVDGGWVDI